MKQRLSTNRVVRWGAREWCKWHFLRNMRVTLCGKYVGENPQYKKMKLLPIRGFCEKCRRGT